MTTLDSSFEDDLREQLLDSAEATLIGERANLTAEFVDLVHANLRAYGQRQGYDVESTIDSVGVPTVDRRRNTVTVTVGWESDQMARWEFGVSPHTIHGQPILSFVWEDPPAWVREEFDQARGSGGQFQSGWRVFFEQVNWGSDTGGIPASRAIRDALEEFRQVVRE